MSLFSDLSVMLDESTGPVFWGTAQVFDALNQSLIESYIRVPEWFTSTSTITLTGDLNSLPSTELMVPQYILGTGTTRMYRTDHIALEEHNEYWKGAPASDTLKHFVLWDWNHIRAWPIPATTVVCTVVGVSWPTEITSTADELVADPLARQVVLHRAASLLLSLSQPELSDHHELLAIENERRYARQRRNTGGALMTRLRPSLGHQRAQGGNVALGLRYR